MFAETTSFELFYTQFIDLKKLNPNLGTSIRHDYLRHEHPIVGVFIDLNCTKADNVLNASSLYRLYNNRYHWILYDELGDISNFRKLFEHANVTVNSDVTYVIPDKNVTKTQNSSSRMFYIQYDVYNNGPHIGGKLNITIDRRIKCEASGCHLERYLSNLYKRSRYGNRDRQNDINLRVGTMITHLPLTAPEKEKIDFLLTENNPSMENIARLGFHQFMILKDIMKFNLDLHWNDQWSLNDLYGGNIGELINETVDITSTTLALSLGRRRFLVPVAESSPLRIVCIFRTPLKSGLLNSGEVYLDPFDRNVWIVLGITIIIGALQLWSIFFIEHNRLQSDTRELPSFLTSFLISFGTVCSQGSYLLPSTTGGRLSYSALILASFIMYNYYTSIIVSTLLGTPVKSDIKTLTQLADSSLEVGFDPINHNLIYMNVSTDPGVRYLVQRKFRSKKDRYRLIMPLEEGLRRVRDQRGRFAYEFDATSAFSIVEKLYEPDEICDLNEISFRPEKYLMNLVHINSSFVEVFRLR